MNRREFVRTAISTATLMAVGVTGLFEMAAKASANQASQQQAQLQLPPVSETTQASTVETPQAQSSETTSVATATSQTTSQAPSAAAPVGYVAVAQLSSLTGKSSAYFTHPSHGESILLDLNGQWRAFSAICTHRLCTLDFTGSELYCPCHGATFNATDGSVTRGPAQTTLGEYGVVVQNGYVYVSDAVVN